ncbi:MAG: TlpA family protein disulfide reductase [Deltaproteobacteria bacterium]|nr:TlpA family protein disulfide reductase [Deltaproteobacteria bacterium]
MTGKALKNNLAIFLAAITLSWLIPVAVLGQQQKVLRNLKLAPVDHPGPAPRFSSMTPGGEKMGIDDFKGKLVVLNFWATWCPPCRLEMPSMERLYQEFKGEGLEVVAINFMEREKPITSFLKENGFTFTVLLDKKGEIARNYGVHGLPVTFLIARNGNLLARSMGYKDWYKPEIRQLISTLLKDDSTFLQPVMAEAKAVEYGDDGQRRMVFLGIGALILLIGVSLLWFRKAKNFP